MATRKISFITTVRNEEASIQLLLDSLLQQTKYPHEVIIVDGGSTDATLEKIQPYVSRLEKKGMKIALLVREGNRSIGRNEAIQAAKGDVIVCTDAGCVLDKKWVEEIVAPFSDEQIDVVAGYYRGKPLSIFQACLIPYVLVMEDQVDPDSFLPASRSIAFRKKVWKKVGGFSTIYSHNEDYVFSRKLQEMNVKIKFQKNAIVYWLPRRTIGEACIMFFRFAYGDAEAGIKRPKVFLIFIRYVALLGIVFIFMWSRRFIILLSIVGLAGLYVVWAIRKNYKYVKNIRAIYFLPLLQFTSDIAVLVGSTLGWGKRIWATLEMQ